jgi:hypothetical protein
MTSKTDTNAIEITAYIKGRSLLSLKSVDTAKFATFMGMIKCTVDSFVGFKQKDLNVQCIFLNKSI